MRLNCCWQTGSIMYIFLIRFTHSDRLSKGNGRCAQWRSVSLPYRTSDLRCESARFLATLQRVALALSADDVSQESAAVLPCTFLISSGSVATRQALEKCGSFREDYFIDDVDTEYCLRAGALDVGVFLNTGLVLNHAIGEREEHRFLGLRVRPSHHSALRRYYRCRNGIHLSSRQVVRLPAFFLHNQKRLAHETIGVILYEEHKLKKLVGILIGMFDGLVGRLGDLSRSSPRLYRWLTTK